MPWLINSPTLGGEVTASFTCFLLITSSALAVSFHYCKPKRFLPTCSCWVHASWTKPAVQKTTEDSYLYSWLQKKNILSGIYCIKNYFSRRLWRICDIIYGGLSSKRMESVSVRAPPGGLEVSRCKYSSKCIIIWYDHVSASSFTIGVRKSACFFFVLTSLVN